MIWTRLKVLLQYYPAILAWAANGGLAVVLGSLTPLSHLQLAAVTTLCSLVATVITAALARPVPVAVLASALGSGLIAASAFGLHLSPGLIGAIVGMVSMVLGLLLHGQLTPTASIRASARHAAITGTTTSTGVTMVVP